MRTIHYDVATSLNGYIAGPDEDISGFPAEGDHVEAYLGRLAGFDTVLMGRRTYEFGFRFGLQPGQRAYPHMQHFVFSRTLELPTDSDVDIVRDDWINRIKQLKMAAGGDIYLCGGGQFAGLLLSNGLVDRLHLKVAPILLPGGVKLCEHLDCRLELVAVSTVPHGSGVVTMEYALKAA
ncbi:MAG: dihydrofolate reductase family protein [Alphaproteobacteria bacterium]|nr:dihydrofolate reductase family protein [Alphaproteobacteria bacterium]